MAAFAPSLTVLAMLVGRHVVLLHATLPPSRLSYVEIIGVQVHAGVHKSSLLTFAIDRQSKM